jgi:hypothetical protein
MNLAENNVRSIWEVHVTNAKQHITLNIKQRVTISQMGRRTSGEQQRSVRFAEGTKLEVWPEEDPHESTLQ